MVGTSQASLCSPATSMPPDRPQSLHGSSRVTSTMRLFRGIARFSEGSPRFIPS